MNSETLILAIPLIVVFYLFFISLYYSFQAYQKYDEKKHKAKILTRYDETLQSVNDFLAVVTHVLNSPVVLMKSSVELMINLKSITKNEIDTIKLKINNLENDINQLITENQISAAQSRDKELVINSNNKPFYKDPSIYTPILSILILLVLSNIILISQNLLTLDPSRILIEVSLFIIGSLILIKTKNNKDMTIRYVTEANKELKSRAIYFTKRREYISLIRQNLSSNLSELKLLNTGNKDIPQLKLIDNGIEILNKILQSLDLVLDTTDMTKDRPLFSVSSFVKKVVEDFRNDIVNKKLAIELDVPNGISIRIENKEIMQLTRSVLKNAIKYSKEGGKILIRLKKLSTEIEIVIQDNGLGISKDRLGNLFKPFSGLNESFRHDPDDIGLDLLVDKVILARMGGSLKVTSEKDLGTTVEIRIPY